ncbi:hypothetical protein PMAYCL1PPCAC_05440, partial [Pristionchus mayeri]
GHTMDPKKASEDEQSLWRLAFWSVSVSTASIIFAIIAVPMCYNYIQHVHSGLQDETDFCVSRSTNLWTRFERFEHAPRTRREAGFYPYHHSSNLYSQVERIVRTAAQRYRTRGAGTYEMGGGAAAAGGGGG